MACGTIKKISIPLIEGCSIFNLTCVVFVEASKGVFNDVFRIRALQPFAKQGQKHREIDVTRCLVHHFVQVFITHLLQKKEFN